MHLLQEYQNIINKELARIFASLHKQVKMGQVPKLLYDAMSYSVFNGGKRIRPVLCLATYSCCQPKTKNKQLTTILPFACGLELIHTFSLIQDDLPSMDNDDFRRGKPSLHRAFDEGIAILAADALFAMAFELFARSPVTDKKKIAAITELAKICGTNGLVSGQILDITIKSQIRLRRTNPPQPDKIQNYINEKKTASLIAGSMKIGAIIANAKANVIKKIDKAGTYLGLLFQTTDDIIDKSQKVKAKSQKVKAQHYATQAKTLFRTLGQQYNWFIGFTDYLLQRQQ